MSDPFLIAGLVVFGVFAGIMFFTKLRNFVVGGVVAAIAGWLFYSELGKPNASFIVMYFMGAIVLGWFVAAVLRYYFVSDNEEDERELSEPDAD